MRKRKSIPLESSNFVQFIFNYDKSSSELSFSRAQWYSIQARRGMTSRYFSLCGKHSRNAPTSLRMIILSNLRAIYHLNIF